MLSAELNRDSARMDNDEPSCAVPNNDVVDVSVATDLMLRLLPRAPMSITDDVAELQKVRASETVEPIRVAARKLKQLPRRNASTPLRTSPQRAKSRKLKVEPNAVESTTLACPPIRPSRRIDTEEPIWAIFSTLHEAPPL
jgi:hypothetical protein